MPTVRPFVNAALVLTVSLALALAACGGEDENEPATSDPGAKPINTVNAVTLNGEWPLTGEKLDGALPEHPVYVVKIDNTSSSAPQIGLRSADLVVEQLVEGGLTRLAVMYYEETPDLVGPVRSMRASDIGIVKPVSATIVASGAAGRTIARLDVAAVPVLTEGATGFSRDDGRSAPYNLFVDLAEVAASPPKRWGAPQNAYLNFAGEGDFAGDIPVRTIAAQFSAGQTTRWEYVDDAWVRPDSLSQEGEDFEPDNVLLLRVRTQDAGYHFF